MDAEELLEVARTWSFWDAPPALKPRAAPPLPRHAVAAKGRSVAA